MTLHSVVRSVHGRIDQGREDLDQPLRQHGLDHQVGTETRDRRLHGARSSPVRITTGREA